LINRRSAVVNITLREGVSYAEADFGTERTIFGTLSKTAFRKYIELDFALL